MNCALSLEAVRCGLVHADPCRALSLSARGSSSCAVRCSSTEERRRAAFRHSAWFTFISQDYYAESHRGLIQSGKSPSSFLSVAVVCISLSARPSPDIVCWFPLFSFHQTELSSITMFPPIEASTTFNSGLFTIYLHPVFFFFLNCVVSLETEFVLYTCWNTCWDRMFIIGCCMLNIISVLKVKRANVLFWIHSSLERKRHRLHEGHYFVHITRQKRLTVTNIKFLGFTMFGNRLETAYVG